MLSKSSIPADAVDLQRGWAGRPQGGPESPGGQADAPGRDLWRGLGLPRPAGPDNKNDKKTKIQKINKLFRAFDDLLYRDTFYDLK